MVVRKQGRYRRTARTTDFGKSRVLDLSGHAKQSRSTAHRVRRLSFARLHLLNSFGG